MRVVLLSVPFLFTALAGCEQPGFAGGSQTALVSQSQTLEGTIIGVRDVSIGNNNDQVAGAVVGGLAGGLLGNQIGRGSGNTLATGAGALGGALAGSRLAAGANDRITQEWTVRLEDGRTISVVQDARFRVGQRVGVVRDGNRTRLIA